jgi:hypothetical protein
MIQNMFPSNLILYLGTFMLKGDKWTHLTESLQRVGTFIKSDVFKYDWSFKEYTF